MGSGGQESKVKGRAELVRSVLMNQTSDKRNIRRFARDHLIVGVSDEETQADKDSEGRLWGGAVHPVPMRRGWG